MRRMETFSEFLLFHKIEKPENKVANDFEEEWTPYQR
jgi:hypothetical protein